MYTTILTDENLLKHLYIYMNVGKYGLVVLIRIASSPFGVFQKSD